MLIVRVLPAALMLAAILVACDESLAPEHDVADLASFTPAAAVSSAAVAPARIDQVQKIADPSRPLAIYPIRAGQNLAQTFTAGLSGDLAYVWMPIACASGALVKIQVRRGGPTGTVLSDYNYDPAHNIQDGTFRQFQIYPYVPLVPGRTYAIVLSSVGRGWYKTAPTCSIASGPHGDSYTGGGAWYEDIPTNGTGWLPLPNRRNQEDLPFATMVW